MSTVALSVFSGTILPIFVLIGIGFLLDRIFRFDLRTLSKLNFYAFVPALVFIKFLQADMSGGMLLKVGAYRLAHIVAMGALVWLVFRGPSLATERTTMSFGAMFHNTGNYGIPLVMLAFGEQYVGVVAVLLMVQNSVMFTWCIWVLTKERAGLRRAAAGLVRIPVLYSIAAALLVRGTGVDVPQQVWVPMQFLSDGLVPVALLTLGAQLSRTQVRSNAVPLAAVTAMRLLVSPLVAAGLVLAFGFGQPVASVLIVCAGLPTAVNVYILAAEYGKAPGLASQIVFWTTLLSAVTLTATLLIVGTGG